MTSPTTRVTTLQPVLSPASGQAAYDAVASTSTVAMPRPSSTTAKGRLLRRFTHRQVPNDTSPAVRLTAIGHQASGSPYALRKPGRSTYTPSASSPTPTA